MDSEDISKQALADLSSSLAKIMEKNPGMSKEQAWAKLREQELSNNPFMPPKDSCPINKLPPELLASIFRLGKQMQEEEQQIGALEDEDEEAEHYKGIIDSVWEENEPVEGEEKNKSMTHVLVDASEDAIAVDDGDAEWEDEGSDSDSDSEMDEDDDEEELEPELPFQVLVSHVCKLWRAIALGTPTLWTTLTFSENPKFEKSRAYIERAKGSPLDIFIAATIPEDWQESDHPDHPDYQPSDVESDADEDDHCGCGRYHHHPRRRSQSAPPQSDPSGKGKGKGKGKEEDLPADRPEAPFLSQKEVSTILDLVCPIVSQWRVFEYSASIYSYIYLLLERLQSLPAAPILEVLQIYHYEDCDEYEAFSPAELIKPFLPFNGNIPRLKDIALWGVHLDWDKSSSFMQGLHDLELAYHAKDVRPSWSTFCAFIANSPDLRTLSLCLSGPSTDEEWTSTPLEIPSVKDLVLCYHEPQYAIALIKHLSFPNVHSLALDYEEQDYTDFARELTVPLKGKSKSLLAGLQNMKIAGLPCGDRAVDGVYEQLAGLKSLNLDCEFPAQEIWFDKLVDPSACSPEGEDDMAASGVSNTATAGSSSSSAAPPPPTSGPKIYCPQLETLTVNGIPGERLKLLVEKRKELGHPIKKMCVPEEAEIEEDEEEWLRENLESLEYFEPSDYDTDGEFEVEMDDIDEDDEDMHML